MRLQFVRQLSTFMKFDNVAVNLYVYIYTVYMTYVYNIH